MTKHMAAEDVRPGDTDFNGSSSLRALVTIAQGLGLHLTIPQLVRDNRLSNPDVSLADIVKCASAAGMKGRRARIHWDALIGLSKLFPVMVKMKDGGVMLLHRLVRDGNSEKVVLGDPTTEEETTLAVDRRRFEDIWDKEVVVLRRKLSLTDVTQPFGFALIFSLIFKERRIVRDVMVVALLISALALGPIIFWRLLSDRVVPFHSMNSFIVLCCVMLVLIGFETAAGALRRYLTLVLVTRVDIRLSTLVFAKVTELPIDYFERTPSGLTLHKMRELSKVRTFLNGPLFGTVLDSFVLFFFLPMMYFLNPLLTAYVVALTCLIVVWIVAMLPTYRRYSGAHVSAQAVRGAFLHETIQGIRTIKSISLESKHRHEWDILTANATRLHYKEGAVANIIQTVVTPIERLVVSGSLALGAYLVLVENDVMFIGALFAFMILSQRVVLPLMNLSQLIQQFDEARTAVLMIAGLVNLRPEEGRDGKGLRIPLQGHVEFEKVQFQYPGAPKPTLRRLSFDVPQGTTLGVMGRSGSGKTTITRLLQCLHSNYDGLIKIDGVDVRSYDLAHLRSSLGVVLQENFLFSGTIRDNIVIAKNDATYDELVNAARLSGAEEFIDKMPRGYETYVYEGSPNLSGGQRQRIAIARALIINPKILILDEATSALDAESEAVVNANIDRIAAGRTVITISHRLSSLVKADAIMVLDDGEINDIGTHEELLARNDIYSGLWFTQNGYATTRPFKAQPKLA